MRDTEGASSVPESCADVLPQQLVVILETVQERASVLLISIHM